MAGTAPDYPRPIPLCRARPAYCNVYSVDHTPDFFPGQSNLSSRESTGKPPLAIQNPVVNFFLTAGIPARNLKEARIAFWVILAAAVFFSVIYYPPFAAIF